MIKIKNIKLAALAFFLPGSLASHDAIAADQLGCSGNPPAQYYWNDVAPKMPGPPRTSYIETNLLDLRHPAETTQGMIAWRTVVSTYSSESLRCWSSKGDYIASYSLGMVEWNALKYLRATQFFEKSVHDSKANCAEFIGKSKCVIFGTVMYSKGLPAAHYALWRIYHINPISVGELEAAGHLLFAAQGGVSDAYEAITENSPQLSWGPND